LFFYFLLAFSVSCSRDGSTPTAAAAGGAQPPQAVRALPASLADVPLEIAAIGNVEASSTVEVKARVTAPVVKVHFAEGQDVRAGQLLFELDPEPFQRQIGEIEANIARDAALAKQAVANIAREEATWKNLATVAESSRKLNREGILSQTQTDQAIANADSAKASLEAAKAAVESARAAEKADRARLHETQLSLEYTKVLAPISGRAGVISAKTGNLARQHDNTLVTLLQNTPVHVTFSVPENLLPEIRKRHGAGSQLNVTAVTADGHTSTGKLDFIDSAVDSTTGGIKLKGVFANADRSLWPGQFVNVKILLNLEQGRVVIPSQATQTGPNGKYVWVLDPATSAVSMRTITISRNVTMPEKGELAVVTSGLQAGENVITEGQKRLNNGTKVRLLQQPAAAGAN
jgi:multidrug efflux system membrane fusion protein